MVFFLWFLVSLWKGHDCLQWCLFVLWLPEAASVGGGCCSLETLSIAHIFLVQHLLLPLLLQAGGEQALSTLLVPGASPCLVGAPKLAHTFAPDAFIELSSIILQGHYLLPDRNWPEKGGWLRWKMGSFPGWGARDVKWIVQRSKELLRNKERVSMVSSSEDGVSEGWCAQQRPDLQGLGGHTDTVWVARSSQKPGVWFWDNALSVLTHYDLQVLQSLYASVLSSLLSSPYFPRNSTVISGSKEPPEEKEIWPRFP